MSVIKLDEIAFETASTLTDPICKVREYAYRASVVEELNPTDSRVTNIARKCFCWLAMLAFAFIALFTTLPGGALRGLISYFKADPFLVQKGVGKSLGEDRAFSLLSWNLCCVAGGYSISDGGVAPWADRMDGIIQKVVESDADLNCFYEMFDAKSHMVLKKALKEHGYTHFYTNIGPKVVGAPSGIMVASKFEIRNPEFISFPQDTLVGRTKWAAKGVFGFDLISDGEAFARIFATHLQHSEIPEFIPDLADAAEIEERKLELEARRRQMEIIVNKAKQVSNLCVVVTGDLNLDNAEYAASSWHHLFEKGDRFVNKTWGGDAFCATLMGKRISGPLNLDHTMVLRGTAESIQTTLVSSGYDAHKYSEKALTDHEGLFSRISI